MFCFIKGITKTALWGTALVGALAVGTTLVAGPNTTKAVVNGIQAKVHQTLDHVKDNPAALRKELMRLEKEYPKRIRAVQKDLGELQVEAKRMRWEQAVSTRVVEMAQADLAELGVLASDSNNGAAEPTLGNNGNVNSLRQAGFPSTRAASAQVQRLETLVGQHSQQAEDAARDLGYIEKEITRFEALLETLETERAQYHAQLSQLNRQVNSIRRNERLLSMLRERQGFFEQASRFESHSLDQITGRLSGIRSQQEAELELLSGSEMEIDYEGRAKAELEWQEATMIQASSCVTEN